MHSEPTSGPATDPGRDTHMRAHARTHAHDADPPLRCSTAPACPLAWLGVVAMAVALVVTSVLTTAAGAQLPSTSPTPGDESAGAGGTAGTVVFFVVVALIVGTAITLFVRHRGNQRR